MLLWISKHHKQNFTNLRFSLKSTWFSCWLPHKHQSIHYTHPPALTGSWLWPAKKIIVEIKISQKRNRISLKETWKSSRQTVHWILAACLLLSIFTYTDLVMSLWTYQIKIIRDSIRCIDLARLFVVAKWTGELGVQCFNVLLPRLWLSLWLPATHPIFWCTNLKRQQSIRDCSQSQPIFI